jgi:hypothetical protein
MSVAGGNPIPLGNAGVIKEQAFDLWRFNGIENLWRDLVLCRPRTSQESGLRVNGAVVARSWNRRKHGDVFANFDNGSETRRVFAVQATKNYFTALGVPVQQGRGWNETDANDVAVLHPHFWRTRLENNPVGWPGYTMHGILPENYRSSIGYGYLPDVFVPQYMEGTILAAYARVKPGMSWVIDQEFPSQRELNKQIRATPASGFARLEKERDAITGLLAALGPVRRALRVDPLQCLRYE